MREHGMVAIHRSIEVGLAACALLTMGACSEPAAVTDGDEQALLVTHSLAKVETIPSRTFLIREVRFGHGIDVDEKVPPSLTSRRFLSGDPVRMSMWVAASPSGSTIRVSVRDAAENVVWSSEAPAPAAGSYLAFDLGRQFARGKYDVEIDVDQDVASRASLDVVDRESWAARR